MRKNLLTALTVTFSIFGLFVSAEAETITKPHTFTDGTPALASEVNANFDTVYDQVNKVGTEVHIDSTNHRVGIGTTNPESKLTIAGEGAPVANSIIAYGGSEGIGNDVLTAFVGLRARGTSSSATAVQQWDLLGVFGAKGHNGTAFPELTTAAISFVATETFTESNQGTKIVFLTTENGSAEKLSRMAINSNGNVGIGTTNPRTKLTIIGEGEKIGNAIVAYGGSTSNDVLPFFVGLRARGSASSPTAVQQGDIFAYFGGKGYYGTGFPDLSTAGISFVAAENFGDANHGTKIHFLTTSKGSITKQTRMKISSSGKVGIGTTDPQSKLQVNGYIQLALTSGSPDSGDCDAAEEYGRMKVDATAGSLYICVASGWVPK